MKLLYILVAERLCEGASWWFGNAFECTAHKEKRTGHIWEQKAFTNLAKSGHKISCAFVSVCQAKGRPGEKAAHEAIDGD